MYQLLKFEEPIPSCRIHSLAFEDGKINFVYAVNTPREITDSMESPLAVYEHISDLKLVEASELHELSVNIKINSLAQYLEFLQKQQKADADYRKSFFDLLKYNSEAIENLNKNLMNNSIKLEKRNYDNDELTKLGVNYIASILEEDNNYAVYAAV